MKLSTFEGAALALGIAASGCDQPQPQKNINPETAISATVSDATNSAEQEPPAINPPHETQLKLKYDIGKPCPNSDVVNNACSGEFMEMELTGDTNKRSQECPSIRKSMRQQFEKFLQCTGEIEAAAQGKCVAEKSLDQKIQTAEVLTQAAKYAQKNIREASEAARLHQDFFCDGDQRVQFQKNNASEWVKANDLIKDIKTVSREFMSSGTIKE